MLPALRIAFCSVDPNGLTTFHAFDPDSFGTANAIADALVQIGPDGSVEPALATGWRRVSPLAMDFDLRRDVQFHDASSFGAEDVVATFRAHREPTPSACGATILAPIVSVTATSLYRVRIETAFPDALLLRRLVFGSIYPRARLEAQGRDLFSQHPIGAGAYRFIEWNRGRNIVLERNPSHWAARATVERVEVCIVREKEWLEKLENGQIDIAFNLDAHDAVRARRLAHVTVKSAAASTIRTFLLRDEGPLADVRVRRALNHAIHRRVLVELTEQGLGAPQQSLATSFEEGHVACEPYRYSPEIARRLLLEAGHEAGLRLRGVVVESCSTLYYGVREFLSRVGVELEAEVVPFNELSRQLMEALLAGRRFDADFILIPMNNPLGHALFLQFVNLFSRGSGSLTRDPEFDAAFMRAATTIEPELSLAAVAAVERLAVERALMLFTVERQAHVAYRDGASARVPRATPDGGVFADLRLAGPAPMRPALELPAARGDMALLLEGTSHTDAFYLKPGSHFEDPAAARVWSNVLTSQQRGLVQNEPLLRQAVSLIEAKDSLASVLESTHRVAIVGYSHEDRRLFVNRGYELMLGSVDRPVTERLARSGDKSWLAIRAVVDARGVWSGAVEIEVEGSYRAFFLTVARAVDEERANVGYTFVFSDFSGEEERIKHGAIRTILDHVPYGLFVCDRAGIVQPGYSAACLRLFAGATLEGQAIVELLGMAPRDAATFRLCYDQVVEDWLPSEVTLSQLQKRVSVGSRVCDLSGAALRSDDQASITGVLFTLLDVTELAQAELEAERLRGVVQVLAFRPSFERFVRDFDAELCEAAAGLRQGRDPAVDIRRMLHTAKGVFAQFSLGEPASLLHEVEDHVSVTVEDLEVIRSALHQLLTRNLAVWGIRLEQSITTYVVSDANLVALRGALDGVETVDGARIAIDRAIEVLRRRPLHELVGPIRESSQRQAERAGKAVTVSLEGFELPVPTHLGPALATLVHLTRNAIDHGIEMPEGRGDKPATAHVRLRALEEAGQLVIAVEDDGRGIDDAALVERAIAAGWLTPERAATLAWDERVALLFLDRVSTTEEVSEISGRGVGMAAVKMAVEGVGGTIAVHSEPGRSSSFVLRLPIALAQPLGS